MRAFFRILSLVIMAAVFSYTVLVFAQQAQSSGNDVYNFYFQKAPGPQTVIQGGAPPAQTSPAAQPHVSAEGDAVAQQQTSPASSNAAPSPATSSAGSDLKKWEISVGLANQAYFESRIHQETKHFGDKNGIGLGARYHFSRYFAAEVGVAYTPKIASSYNEESPSQNIYKNFELEKMPQFNGHAGIKLTPIHVDLFGHDLIEMGASFGATTYALMEQDISEGIGMISTQAATKIGGYIAPTLGVNISKDFGADLSTKFLIDRKIENNRTNVATNLNVRWRF